jgi:phage-related protein
MFEKHKVVYFSYLNKQPIKDFIESLNEKQQAKIFRIFRFIIQYGIFSIPRHTKKIINTPFWEIRILGEDNIRLIYIILEEHSVLILHGFVKKTQKTNPREISISKKRLMNWKNNLDK